MNKLYTAVYWIIWVVFRVVHPWKAKGETRLPEGGVLLCGNHTTMSDPLYVLLSIGPAQQSHVMAKAELMRIPVLGWLLAKCGIFGVERGKADVLAIKTAMKILKNGERLLMFPEGTRVKEGEEGVGHTGAAMLATRTGVPIVPIYIPRDKKWFRKTTLVFGTPYIPEFEGRKLSPEEYEKISKELMKRIYDLKGQAE